MNTQKKLGFSLVEVLVVIGIGAILLASAMPAMNEYLRNNRLTSQTNTLVATINFARGEAITRNQNVFVSALPSSDAGNTWGKGWEVWVDGRQDGEGTCVLGTNPVNRTHEDCETLRVFDFSSYAKIYPKITTNPATLDAISAANLSDANLLKSTLMFRGSDGGLALGNGGASVDILICDTDAFNDKKRPGRQLNISRTGRVSLVTDALTACP
ncbi:MAG: Tfp pilus assembly protein FimT [Pseudomonadota bacterium]|jgi:prepilin-type N-terminal cleavage/methylation domain-containing protein